MWEGTCDEGILSTYQNCIGYWGMLQDIYLLQKVDGE